MVARVRSGSRVTRPNGNASSALKSTRLGNDSKYKVSTAIRIDSNSSGGNTPEVTTTPRLKSTSTLSELGASNTICSVKSGKISDTIEKDYSTVVTYANLQSV